MLEHTARANVRHTDQLGRFPSGVLSRQDVELLPDSEVSFSSIMKSLHRLECALLRVAQQLFPDVFSSAVRAVFVRCASKSMIGVTEQKLYLVQEYPGFTKASCVPATDPGRVLSKLRSIVRITEPLRIRARAMFIIARYNLIGARPGTFHGSGASVGPSVVETVSVLVTSERVCMLRSGVVDIRDVLFYIGAYA